jgi:hypothetical protein
MTRRVLLAAFTLLLLPSATAAQGLIAFPWRVCPTVDGQPRCVWVADAPQRIIRPRELIEGTFRIEWLNPGTDVANVVVQIRNHGGGFVRSGNLPTPPGRVLGAPPIAAFAPGARVTGSYVIVTSDRPLLLWAWIFEHHFPSSPPSVINNPPTSISSFAIQVIPVDCADAGVVKTFGFLCTASEGPPPPFAGEELSEE